MAKKDFTSSFLLEPDVVFLNHGSFGACPREVFEVYQDWQRKLESQPVRFLQRELPDLIANARARLAEFLHCEHRNVVFVPNPTFAVNEIARSIDLHPGDEILMSDQEYGACLFCWRFIAAKTGARIVEQPIKFPVKSNASIIDQFWEGLSDNTKVIFLSHITAPTALTIPVKEICDRARERGILTIIDGAHAPGQIHVDLTEIGANFYTGTCHKWLCAPKGAGFLYADSQSQQILEPLVVGWGWGDDRTFKVGSDFLDFHEWTGTHDPANYLSVPSAIEFQRRNNWEEVQQECHELVTEAIERASQISGISRVHEPEFYRQMGLLEVDSIRDAQELKAELYEIGKIEVPVFNWRETLFIRFSIQAYNSSSDIDKFVEALSQLTLNV